MKTKPGEIWLADLGFAGKTRPVLILSREDPNPPRMLAVYVPLTTQNRQSEYEVDLGKLPFLNAESTANVQGIASLPAPRLLRKLGALSDEKLEQVKNALRIALEL